jgi:hypothetical protein
MLKRLTQFRGEFFDAIKKFGVPPPLIHVIKCMSIGPEMTFDFQSEAVALRGASEGLSSQRQTVDERANLIDSDTEKAVTS